MSTKFGLIHEIAILTEVVVRTRHFPQANCQGALQCVVVLKETGKILQFLLNAIQHDEFQADKRTYLCKTKEL